MRIVLLPREKVVSSENDQAAAHSLGLSRDASGETGNPGGGRARLGVVGDRITVKTGMQRAFMIHTECGVVGKGQMMCHVLLLVSP